MFLEADTMPDHPSKASRPWTCLGFKMRNLFHFREMGSGQDPVWPQTHDWLGTDREVVGISIGRGPWGWAASDLVGQIPIREETDIPKTVGGHVCKSQATQLSRGAGMLAQVPWAGPH